ARDRRVAARTRAATSSRAGARDLPLADAPGQAAEEAPEAPGQDSDEPLAHGIPSGITLAIGSSLSCPGASGASSAAWPGASARGRSRAPARDEVAARVRAATLRSRADSCRP